MFVSEILLDIGIIEGGDCGTDLLCASVVGRTFVIAARFILIIF